MPLMYRVKTEFTGLPGMPGLNQLYFDASDSTATQAAQVVGAFWSAVGLRFNDSLIWTVLPDVEIVEDTTGEIKSVAQTPGSTGTGASSSDPLPFATQALVRLRTGEFAGGREIRGRIYIPGLTDVDAVNGQLGATATTTIENAAAEMADEDNASLVVFSRSKGRSARVTATSAWNQFAVLRSRRD